MTYRDVTDPDHLTVAVLLTKRTRGDPTRGAEPADELCLHRRATSAKLAQRAQR